MLIWILRFVVFGAVGFGAYQLGSLAVDIGQGRFMDAEEALQALLEDNERPAIFALQRLEGAGDPKVAYALGFAYLNGRGVQRDVGRGRDLLLSAVDQGIAGAAVALGDHARRDLPFSSFGWDLQGSLPWYLRAAELGDSSGMLGAGVALVQRGAAGDSETARKWLERAAAAGNVYAGFHLGEGYLGGRLGAVDTVKAAEWYAQGGLAGDYNALQYAIQLANDDTLESFNPEMAYMLSVVGHNWWPNPSRNDIVFPSYAMDALFGEAPELPGVGGPDGLFNFYAYMQFVDNRMISVPRLAPGQRPQFPDLLTPSIQFDNATLLRLEAQAREIIASSPRPLTPDWRTFYECICPTIRNSAGPPERAHHWLWSN